MMTGWRQTVTTASILLCLLGGAGAARAQGDSAVATVNGDPLSGAEFYERLQRVNVRDFIISTTPLTVRTQTAGQILLDQMINERLTIQWASKTNLLPSDADVQAELSRAKSQPQVQQALAAHQLSEDFLKQSIRFQKARYAIATTGATVSAQEVEAYYGKHIADYTIPERLTLEGLSTTKQADILKAQADLKAGKPFADVVKAYCEDPNLKARNGAMGSFTLGDQGMPQAVREAAAPLQPGQVSGPVKVDTDGPAGRGKVTIWWILRMVKRVPGTVQPFVLVKTMAEQAALLEKAGGMQVADKKISEYRQLSDVKINLPGYDTLVPRPRP